MTIPSLNEIDSFIESLEARITRLKELRESVAGPDDKMAREVLNHVAGWFGTVTVDDLLSKKRIVPLLLPRFMAYRLLYELRGSNASHVARLMRRIPSSIESGLDSLQCMMDTDPKVKASYEACRDSFLAKSTPSTSLNSKSSECGPGQSQSA